MILLAKHTEENFAPSVKYEVSCMRTEPKFILEDPYDKDTV